MATKKKKSDADAMRIRAIKATDSEWQQWQEYAKSEDMPLAALIRRLLRKEIERAERNKKAK